MTPLGLGCAAGHWRLRRSGEAAEWIGLTAGCWGLSDARSQAGNNSPWYLARGPLVTQVPGHDAPLREYRRTQNYIHTLVTHVHLFPAGVDTGFGLVSGSDTQAV
jgi:hypothetical protein